MAGLKPGRRRSPRHPTPDIQSPNARPLTRIPALDPKTPDAKKKNPGPNARDSHLIAREGRFMTSPPDPGRRFAKTYNLPGACFLNSLTSTTSSV